MTFIRDPGLFTSGQREDLEELIEAYSGAHVSDLGLRLAEDDELYVLKEKLEDLPSLKDVEKAGRPPKWSTRQENPRVQEHKEKVRRLHTGPASMRGVLRLLRQTEEDLALIEDFYYDVLEDPQAWKEDVLNPLHPFLTRLQARIEDLLGTLGEWETARLARRAREKPFVDKVLNPITRDDQVHPEEYRVLEKILEDTAEDEEEEEGELWSTILEEEEGELWSTIFKVHDHLTPREDPEEEGELWSTIFKVHDHLTPREDPEDPIDPMEASLSPPATRQRPLSKALTRRERWILSARLATEKHPYKGSGPRRLGLFEENTRAWVGWQYTRRGLRIIQCLKNIEESQYLKAFPTRRDKARAALEVLRDYAPTGES